MNVTTNKPKSDFIRKVAKTAPGSLNAKQKTLFGKFTRRFLGNLLLTELSGKGVKPLAGLTAGTMKTAARRRVNETIVHVYNPDQKRDGWQNAHTIVEVAVDDMPFIIDSVNASLTEMNLTVHLVIHTVIRVKRDKSGRLKDIVDIGATGPGIGNETILAFEVSQQSGKARLAEIENTLADVLKDVRAAVEDWQAMRGQIQAIINELKLRFAVASTSEISEAQDFLEWAHDDLFTFLGYREYQFVGKGSAQKIQVNSKSGLGILRNSNRHVFNELHYLENAPVKLRNLVNRLDPIFIGKSQTKSTIHRSALMDVIGVKTFNDNGQITGERLFVGLFTSVAYSKSPSDIPILRRKIDKTILRAGFPPTSHDGKALLHILETYPRDELFQISDDDLMEISLGIMRLQEHLKLALFVRHDDFSRFVSCLIFVPRDRFGTDLRLKMQDVLEDAYGGEISGINMEFTEAPLARLHLTISIPNGRIPKVDVAAVEAELTELARSWTDHLQRALIDVHGEEAGNNLCAVYGDAFPASYAENFDAGTAINDVYNLEQVVETDALTLDLYRPANATRRQLRFKVFHPHRPLPLSDVLPVLEHMGLKVIDEIPHTIRPDRDSHRLIMIHDFGLVARDNVDLESIRDNFHEVFRQVWTGGMESDGFNALVIGAGLTWRDIVILRTYAKYLRQAKAPFSQEYMERALTNNSRIAGQISQFFKALFDPKQRNRDREAGKIERSIENGLNKVQSADEDRILRRFLNGVTSTLRTNYFQAADDGGPKSYLSIKLDSAAIDELPLPRPMREIFVYSPQFEAIHLRGGLVARGGLRWSDRPEDFRTEILSLMKAQMVKNAVIVPVGSKGGFVVKRPPTEGGRDAFIEEGIKCYKMFMGGLLDITDNLSGAKLIPPKDVVRRDGDDPYLVVAADKGTATFSDIANGVSADYGFWLGDAFASGGSVGYDHKKMGITARGAWESVKRHFREIGKDIQTEEFTVVGVGDMSGDVFGNAMLLSKHIKLLAAFNHLHIFVDPDPSPAKSFAERERLFQLPRSNWADYNAKLISKGGGIFSRSAKSIKVSPEMRKTFDIQKPRVTPNELIRILLRAEIELLWFGGIGTYVKESGESHLDAGDRANDGLRVDADELRCQVIGEGANLGVTQRSRIEFALNGGHLNTDSVDNSAGVDCSDHEVNIKILLDAVVAKKKLTQAQRNKLLKSMTDEVGELVLRDNYLQTQAITVTRSQDAQLLDVQTRFLRMLEKSGRLDRSVEFLPDDETLEERERDKTGLTRPEICVVMPYAKLWLYDEILASDLPDDAILQADLIDYFPTALRKKYKPEILVHRLNREIISTVVTNSMINRVGGTFVTNLMEKSGAPPVDIARAYLVARDAFRLEDVWSEIESLDNQVSADMQITLHHDVSQLIERSTLWILRNVTQPIRIGKKVREFRPGIQLLESKLHAIVPVTVTDRIDFRVKRYKAANVPDRLARRVAYLLLLVSALDIVRTSEDCGMKIENVARLYFDVGELFGLGWLRYNAEKLPAENHWQKLATAAMIEELYSHQRGITIRIVEGENGAGKGTLSDWGDRNGVILDQSRNMLSELESAETVDLAMLAVASRYLSAISGGGG